jgi:hypothetical protein
MLEAGYQIPDTGFWIKKTISRIKYPVSRIVIQHPVSVSGINFWNQEGS